MQPILTITLNPALDLATSAPHVEAGPKLRCDVPRADPGGGGVNVSRAVERLGGDSLALVALGGATGAQMAMLLEAEGIRSHRIDAPGETRQSLAVTDRATGGQYRFVMPGPTWDEADIVRAIDAIAEITVPGALVVLSGSLPPGIPADFPVRLAAHLPRARLLVDTSGAHLTTLAAGPTKLFALRIDGEEAEALAGHPLADPAATAAFAATLVARGVAQAVLLARGAEGNVMVTAEGAWIASCPPQPVASAVGAGDSFVGGFVLALAQEAALPEALRHGSAAASAAVLTEGTELCRRADFEAILPRTTLTRIAPAIPT